MENSLKTTARSSLMGSFVFLMLSLPLGIFYFVFTVTGIALGTGMLVIWVGLPILFITLLCVRGMAEIERRLVSSLLRMPQPYQMPAQRESGRGFLRRFGNLLRDPYTWTSMLYMLLKLPIGIISFTLALTLPILSLALTLLPLTYLINLFINMILLKNGIASSSIIIPYFLEIHETFDPVMFARSFAGVPVGIIMWFVTRFVLNGLGHFSGELANALLGPGLASFAAQPHQQYHAEEQPIYQEQRASME